MKELYQKYKLFFIILFIALSGFLLWYFFNIVQILVIAWVVFIIGFPLVSKLDRLKPGRHKFPHFLSVFITLLILIVAFLILASFFIPLFIQEARMISGIDMAGFTAYYRTELGELQKLLYDFGIMPHEVSISDFIEKKLFNIINFGFITGFIKDIFSFTGRFFFDFF